MQESLGVQAVALDSAGIGEHAPTVGRLSERWFRLLTTVRLFYTLLFEMAFSATTPRHPRRRTGPREPPSATPPASSPSATA